MTGWRNRIVGHGEEAPDQLLANPGNWRIHPKAQQAALAGAIEDIGFIRSVTVNRTSGHVIDGHLRVALALRNNEATIPVEYVEMSEAEEAEALLTLDPIAAMAAADKEKLDALLRDVATGSEAVQAMLAELAAKSGLDWGKPDEADAEPAIDKAAELQALWQTEVGDLWAIGDHRLACGDCTDKAVVERVMGGERAGAVVTDPPYGIEQPGIPHDTPEEQARLYAGCLSVMQASDTAFLVFQSPRLFPSWLDAIRAAGHKFERILMMYKPNDQTYPWRGWLLTSEAILASSLGKAAWLDVHPFQHDVYSVNITGREIVDGGTKDNHGPMWHGSVKPLAVVQDLISRVGGIVFDPFLGSGTTMVACQNLGRKCRGIEVSPGYVAVALQRMQDAFGITGTRVAESSR